MARPVMRGPVVEYYINSAQVPPLTLMISKFFNRRKLNFITYLESTRRDENIDGWHVAGGGRTRHHAPTRALGATARNGHVRQFRTGASLTPVTV